MNKMDLRESEHCDDMKEIASKVGIQVVCNDEDEKEYERDLSVEIHAGKDEDCEKHKEVVSARAGVQIVCDDEE